MSVLFPKMTVCATANIFEIQCGFGGFGCRRPSLVSKTVVVAGPNFCRTHVLK